MKKLKFLEEVRYNGQVFASKGEVKEVSEENGFADRWIRRGAVEVFEEIAKEETVVGTLDKVEDVLGQKIEQQLEEKLGEDLDVEVKIEKASKSRKNKSVSKT